MRKKKRILDSSPRLEKFLPFPKNTNQFLCIVWHGLWLCGSGSSAGSGLNGFIGLNVNR